MKLTLDARALRAELKVLVKVIPSKPPFPVLSNVLLSAADGRLALYATDLEVGLATSCEATVTTPGTMTLPALKLLEMVQHAPQPEVTLALSKHHATLTSGSFTTRLQTHEAQDFPTQPTPTGPTYEVPGAALKQMIKRVRYAIAKHHTGRTIDGALMMFHGEIITLATIDGRRLSVATKFREPGDDVALLVPSKALDNLLEFSDDGVISCSHNQQSFFFTHGHRTLMSRIIDGVFPKYANRIPRDYPYAATLDRAAFAATVKRVGLAADTEHTTHLLFENNQLTVTAVSAEIGEAKDTLAILYTGPQIKVCVSWRSVLDFLEHASNEQTVIALKDDRSHLLLTDGTEGAEFLNVVMVQAPSE